jgi:serine/threonine protein kinase
MNSLHDPSARASKKLVGQRLIDGWVVESEVVRTGSQTGSFFSTGYIVRHPDGRTAFLKAIDFSEALKSNDFARAVQSIASQFNFERDLLEFCNGKRMRNVVRSIGGGTVDLDNTGSWLSRVQYFLFEPADGDVRKALDLLSDATLAWGLGVLHQAALGLDQLHAASVVHQDVKPSNLLMFDRLTTTKVGDLGCASSISNSNPRDAFDIPGQVDYAPPEQLYGYFSPDWAQRRVASDMYQLGSVAMFLFSGMLANTMLATKLSPGLHWTTPGTTYGDALPFLRDAFGKVLADLRQSIQGKVESAIVTIIEQLCEPDLARRGDPNRIRRKQNQYSLEPYISRLGNLMREAEIAARRKLRP